MKPNTTSIEDFLKDIEPFFYRRRVTFVDVGAFKGEVLEKVLASGLNVGEAHLVEPNPVSLKYAKERGTSGFKGHSVNYYGLAVGAHPGRVRMHAAKTMTRVIHVDASEIDTPTDDDNVFEVDCSTIDLLSKSFTEHRASILKIDVEGFEADALEGARQLLADQRADCIYIEAGMNPEGQQQCYYRRIEDILVGHGYRLFRIYEQHNEWLEDSPLLRRVNLAFMSSQFAKANPYRLTRELFQAHGRIGELEAELARVTDRSDAVAVDLRRLQGQLEASAADAEMLHLERTRWQTDRAQAAQTLAAERATHHAQAAESRREAARLGAQIEQLSRQADASAGDAKALQSEKEHLQAEHARVMKALTSEREAHRARVADLEREAVRLEVERDEAARRRLQDQERRLTAEAGRARDDALAELHSHKSEVEKLRSALNAQLATSKVDAQVLGEELSRLRANLVQADRARGESQALLADRTRQLEEEVARGATLQERHAGERQAMAQAIRIHHHESQRAHDAMEEILESVREIDQREVKAMKSIAKTRSKLAGIRARPVVRLALAARSTLRSSGGWARLPAAVWREYGALRAERHLPINLAPQAEATPALVFDDDKSGLSLPLTVRSHRVEFGAMDGGQVIYGRTLSVGADDVVTIQVTVSSPDGLSRVARIGGVAVGTDDLHMSSLRRQIKMTSGQQVALVELAGSASRVELEISRVRGQFGLLLLALVAMEVTSQPLRPVSTDVKSMRKGTAKTNTPTDGAVPSRKQAAKSATAAIIDTGEKLALPAPAAIAQSNFGDLAIAAPNHPSAQQKAAYSAEELDKKLWGGFAIDALPALEQLKLSNSVPTAEREAAAWYLVCWHYAHDDFSRALESVDFVKRINNRAQSKFILAGAQCLMATGQLAEANALLERGTRILKKSDFELLRSTVIRLSALRDGRSVRDADALQLAALNAVLAKGPLAPIELRDSALPLTLSNIASRPPSGPATQPLKVSVVMPTYNAAASIVWVIRSLLEQTWRNLEIVVVDDLSTDTTVEVVSRLASADPRVKLVRNEHNMGAYKSRNAGARAATGDLITVHDSDDWSHPQKIERHVAALQQNPGAVVVISHWVRVSENLEVVGSWLPKGTLYDINFSSMMFRRTLFDTIGFWDDVLVSGDAEFYFRIQAIYGKESVVKLPRSELLALSLTRADSLTRSKATHLSTLFFGLRWHYRDAYMFWHAKLRRDDGELPFDPSPGRRPFPVTVGNRPERKAVHRYDLVVIGDLAMRGGAFVSTLNYIVAAAESGRSVAVFHWRKYSLSTTTTLQPRLYEACLGHGIDILSHSDQVIAETVLIGYPAILANRIEPMPKITTKHLFVIINQFASRLVDGGDVQYDPTAVRRLLKTHFGMEGIWIPISNWVMRLMRADTRYPTPYPAPWCPMIDVESCCARPLQWRGETRERPIVGRHGRDTYTKWPSDRAALAAAYGVGQNVSVRFLGGAAHAVDMLGGQPENWSIVGFDGLTAQDFLQDLDFYVHYPHEKYIEEFGRGVMEAMAAGIPVILPSQFRETFGDAVSYAEPSGVADVIAQLWASCDRYMERARIGREFVFSNCDRKRFDERLKRAILFDRPESGADSHNVGGSDGSPARTEKSQSFMETVA